jgi:hypothetical protein
MCGRPSGLESATIGTVVPYGDNLYVRSVKGRDGAWFRGAHVAHKRAHCQQHPDSRGAVHDHQTLGADRRYFSR